MRPSALAQFLQPAGKLLNGLVPSNRLKSALTALPDPFERLEDTVGMVELGQARPWASPIQFPGPDAGSLKERNVWWRASAHRAYSSGG